MLQIVQSAAVHIIAMASRANSQAKALARPPIARPVRTSAVGAQTSSAIAARPRPWLTA